MLNTGWIPLHRNDMNHWTWNKDTFDSFHAWKHLEMMAAHCDKYFEYRGSIYPLKKGEMFVSQRKLGKVWGWSLNKVRRFLKALTDERLITLETGLVLTKVTICNYEEKFGYECTKGNSGGIRSSNNSGNGHGISSGNQNNNINNINNINKPTMRAREEFMMEDFLNIIDFEKLTSIWNQLNLKHLEFLDDVCREKLFNAFLIRIEIDFPDLPNIDEVDYETWMNFIDQNRDNIPNPNEWVMNYLQFGFKKILTNFHRGSNEGGWIADFIYALKPETLAIVRRETGEY